MSIMMVMPTKKRKVDEDDVGDIGYNGIIKSMDMDDDDIYIMVKCLFVCMFVTKNHHFHSFSR